jgi:hypothetical protein
MRPTAQEKTAPNKEIIKRRRLPDVCQFCGMSRFHGLEQVAAAGLLAFFAASSHDD